MRRVIKRIGGKQLGLLLWVALTGSSLLAEVVRVETAGELAEALCEAEAGTQIQLAAGEWKDLDLVILAQGRADQPVIVEAETAGLVKLTGRTSIRLVGQHIVLRGLHFAGAVIAEGREALVSLRSAPDKTASNCRLTELYFDHCNPEDPLVNYPWIRLYGHQNRVDHCRFEGQSHKGRAIQVRVYETDPGHRIDHNYFVDRLPGEESNGYEVIQVGLSKDSMKPGNVLIERNIFERCDGETEIISSKSWSNVIRENLFLNSSGTVTLRHGKNNKVIDNVFIGAGKAGTGGIRVVDSGHIIRGNHFSGLTGRTGGVIVLYCGIPDSSLNGYFPASKTIIEANTFRQNSGNSIYLTGGFGSRNRILFPENVRIEGNAFGQPTGSGVVAIAGHLDDLQLKDNQHAGGMETGLAPATGLTLNEDLTDATDPPEVPQHTAVGPPWISGNSST